MKVLIGDDWEEFDVEFGEKMPDNIGGVRVIHSDELIDALWSSLDREILEVSVSWDIYNGGCVVLQFINDDLEEDYYGYLAQLTTEETLTYSSQLG